MKFSSASLITLLAITSIANAQNYEESEASRQEICYNNEKDCESACYCHDKSEPKENKCDPKTLTFTCLCGSGYNPPNSNTTFSAYYATCNIKHNTCRDSCNGEPICAQDCQRKFDECNKNQNKENKCKTTEENNAKNPKPESTKTDTKPKDDTSNASYSFVSYSSTLFASIAVGATYLLL